ncbi:FAS1 domain-containing protein [Cercophora scortea]|uniref:FAS1 domain-containing protein n=1 Tax=Cercophora scortea TaxID=314031 RepID=A0AAE0MD63_9PEZI|nr:FAS1 domain-containing protein [Cercophora scortea]
MKLAKHLLAMPIAVGISAQTFSDVLSDPNAALELLNSYLAGEEALFALLSTAKDITVLAPSNEALYRLENDEAMIARFAADPGMMGAFLKYHVFSGVWYSSSFTAAKSPVTFVPTMLNDTAFTNVTGGQRVKARAKNGEVVLYSGMLTQTPIRSANYNFSGGTIHIIDRVLTIPANITDTLVSANLTAAAGALKVAKMAQGIGQGNQVTVLAPDNDAFNAIGKVIGAMSTADLAAVMGYHVIPGQALYSDMIKNGSTETTTTQNEAVLFRVEDGAIFVNGARVIQTDILFDNGVIHMLDGVLNPQNTSAAPNPTAATQAPAFSGAGTTNGVPFTSGIGTPTSAGPTATVTDLGPLPVAGAPVPLRTGAVRAALLFGGAAMFVNA